MRLPDLEADELLPVVGVLATLEVLLLSWLRLRPEIKTTLLMADDSLSLSLFLPDDGKGKDRSHTENQYRAYQGNNNIFLFVLVVQFLIITLQGINIFHWELKLKGLYQSATDGDVIIN